MLGRSCAGPHWHLLCAASSGWMLSSAVADVRQSHLDRLWCSLALVARLIRCSTATALSLVALQSLCSAAHALGRSGTSHTFGVPSSAVLRRSGGDIRLDAELDRCGRASLPSSAPLVFRFLSRSASSAAAEHSRATEQLLCSAAPALGRTGTCSVPRRPAGC